jgi:hypothetical protein
MKPIRLAVAELQRRARRTHDGASPPRRRPAAAERAP